MSDPVADAVKEEIPETKVETKPDATNTDVVNALKEVKEELKQKGEPAPTREQIREAMKEKTGFTDTQLDLVEQMQRATANASSKKVAELQEKVTWNEFEKEVGGRIDSSLEKIMKEELKEYPVESRGDKVLLQKVYYMSLGIQADKLAKARRADPANNDKLSTDPKIERTTIVETNKGSVQGLDGSGKSNINAGDKLSDDEKTIANKMGISHNDYAKSKSSIIVGEKKPPAVFRGASA